MYCPNCGNKVRRESKYCPNCGNAVNGNKDNAEYFTVDVETLSEKHKDFSPAEIVAIILTALALNIGVLIMILH